MCDGYAALQLTAYELVKRALEEAEKEEKRFNAAGKAPCATSGRKRRTAAGIETRSRAAAGRTRGTDSPSARDE